MGGAWEGTVEVHERWNYPVREKHVRIELPPACHLPQAVRSRRATGYRGRRTTRRSGSSIMRSAPVAVRGDGSPRSADLRGASRVECPLRRNHRAGPADFGALIPYVPPSGTPFCRAAVWMCHTAVDSEHWLTAWHLGPVGGAALAQRLGQPQPDSLVARAYHPESHPSVLVITSVYGVPLSSATRGGKGNGAKDVGEGVAHLFDGRGTAGRGPAT